MSTETISASAPIAIDGLLVERRRWAAAAIFTALAMASLDTAIANIALPAIAADLHASPADVIWVVNVYQIALVATLLPFAALGEIVGHRRIFSRVFCCSRWHHWLAPAPGRCRACYGTRAAGSRRQRYLECEYGTGSFRLSGAPGGPRFRVQCAGRCDRVHARPDGRLWHSRGRAVDLAVCDQYPLRRCCDFGRSEDIAAYPQRRGPSIFPARCWLRPVWVFSLWGSEALPIMRARACIRSKSSPP